MRPDVRRTSRPSKGDHLTTMAIARVRTREIYHLVHRTCPVPSDPYRPPSEPTVVSTEHVTENHQSHSTPTRPQGDRPLDLVGGCSTTRTTSSRTSTTSSWVQSRSQFSPGCTTGSRFTRTGRTGGRSPSGTSGVDGGYQRHLLPDATARLRRDASTVRRIRPLRRPHRLLRGPPRDSHGRRLPAGARPTRLRLRVVVSWLEGPEVEEGDPGVSKPTDSGPTSGRGPNERWSRRNRSGRNRSPSGQSRKCRIRRSSTAVANPKKPIKAGARCYTSVSGRSPR